MQYVLFDTKKIKYKPFIESVEYFHFNLISFFSTKKL